MLDFSLYPRFNLFRNKSILAIDFGFKVTGTAIYKVGIDPYPSPFQKIIFKDIHQVFSDLKKIIDSETIDVIVFGIPFFIDGKESEMTKKLKQVFLELSNEIKNDFPAIELFTQDETLTTQTAQERMKNSPEYNFKIDLTKIDCLSATIILEDFIRDNPTN